MDSQASVSSSPLIVPLSCIIVIGFVVSVSIILILVFFLALFCLYFCEPPLWISPRRNHDTEESINSSLQDESSLVSVHDNLTSFQIFLLEVLESLQEEEERDLREEALEMLPAPVRFRKTSKSDECECVICLEYLVDGESCRIFRACNHIFHLNCIDNWLRDHMTCPLCRDYVINIPEF